jgi:hypothetical protein
LGLLKTQLPHQLSGRESGEQELFREEEAVGILRAVETREARESQMEIGLDLVAAPLLCGRRREMPGQARWNTPRSHSDKRNDAVMVVFDIEQRHTRGIGPHSRENCSSAPNDTFIRERSGGIKGV